MEERLLYIYYGSYGSWIQMGLRSGEDLAGTQPVHPSHSTSPSYFIVRPRDVFVSGETSDRISNGAEFLRSKN
jgi:hypothetical protein